MCATENSLNQKSYHGPTGTMQWSGPVDEYKVENFVHDRQVAQKLWTVSEKATNCKWGF